MEQYPGLKAKLNPHNLDAPIDLREVDEDIGHTLIHYLFTGQYQTLALDPDDVRIVTEFKRSVLAYCAARLCGIERLEELTKAKVEELSKGLSIFDIQKVAEEVSPKLPRKGDWFSTQINKWIKAALMADDILPTEGRLIEVIGRCTIFDKAVVKGLGEMYSELKVKPPNVTGSKAPLERELTESLTKNASITAVQDKADGIKQNGIVSQELKTFVSTG